MESISKILDAISEESRAAAARILENGRNSAEELKKLYDREAQIAEEGIIAEAEKTAEERILWKPYYPFHRQERKIT